MEKIIKNQSGFTGVDVAVSIVLLTIFLTVISTIFLNIYLSYTDSQRNTVAMAYASQIAELVDKLYFQDISEDADSEFTRQINDNVVTNKAYKPRFTITEYTSAQTEIPTMVKVVDIVVEYKVGNTTKNVGIKKTKVKEVLITPNKPIVTPNMVPVKFVYTDFASGLGYWQITTEADNTWYSYDNKVWAATMQIDDQLITEGNIDVTRNNKESLAGKKIIKEGPVSLWVPKYANYENNIVFLYSTSDNIVNSSGNLEPKGNDYIVSNVFTNNTGFWIETSDINDDTNEGRTAKILQQSKYGK